MSASVRVLIVEDQSLIAESLAAMLARNQMEVVGICQSGEEAIEKARLSVPNVLLMDIHLKGALDGIATAKIINDEAQIPIIYLSDHTDSKTVDRAKQTFPASYLAKPFNEPDLVRAIDIAITNANKNSESKSPTKKYIFIRIGTKLFPLKVADLCYLEADRSYCKIVSETGSELLSTSMNHIYEQLPPGDFARIHRKYTVNLNKISMIEGNTLRVRDRELPIGGDYREGLMNRINVLK
jgi:DNA-binding LytR/AlgR family response regulator